GRGVHRRGQLLGDVAGGASARVREAEDLRRRQRGRDRGRRLHSHGRRPGFPHRVPRRSAVHLRDSRAQDRHYPVHGEGSKNSFVTDTADVVVCGAGIAGLAAAYHLCTRQRVGRVIVVDELPAMSLTTDKGTQGYRNWWPGPDDTMFRFVSRSIDLLEDSAAESGNVFRLNRRGYVFATSNEGELARLEATARQVSAFGMGDVRVHRSIETYAPAPAEGFADQPTGADLLLVDAARSAFPSLSPSMAGALHVRRAGFMSGVNLGAWFLAQAAATGASFRRDRVVSVGTNGGRVSEIGLASGSRIATDRLVVAAGPALPEVAGLLGVTLPVFHELHAKVAFRDRERAIRRDAPFLIGTDPLHIDWSLDERARFGDQQDFPGGVHIRPVDLVHGDE